MTKDHSLAVTLRPYVAGGSGAIFSSMCIHPIDLVKVRLQVANSTVEGKVSAVSIAKNVVKNEGVKGLFSGLSAAIARQAVYGTAKIGLHDASPRHFSVCNNGRPSFYP